MVVGELNYFEGDPVKTSFTICICCCLAWVLASCSTTPGTVESGKERVLEPVSCIAVLPAGMGSDEEIAKTGDFNENVRNGAEFANSVLLQELNGNPKARIVTVSQLGGEVMGSQVTTIDQASRITGCDAVLMTTVFKFKQRQGTTYAADEPASASFDMRLYSTGSKNVIWAADFSETQESLLSNIFSFGKAQSRGFKWITVEDMVTQGIKERLAGCPYL